MSSTSVLDMGINLEEITFVGMHDGERVALTFVVDGMSDAIVRRVAKLIDALEKAAKNQTTSGVSSRIDYLPQASGYWSHLT